MKLPQIAFPIKGGEVDGSMASGGALAFNPSFSEAAFFYLFIYGDAM